ACESDRNHAGPHPERARRAHAYDRTGDAPRPLARKHRRPSGGPTEQRPDRAGTERAPRALLAHQSRRSARDRDLAARRRDASFVAGRMTCYRYPGRAPSDRQPTTEDCDGRCTERRHGGGRRVIDSIPDGEYTRTWSPSGEIAYATLGDRT